MSVGSILGSLSRSQISSAIATGVDFGLLFLLVEVFGVWYVAAVAAGAFAGAVTNFLINRHWSFRAAGGHASRQARRYAVVSLGSLLLNSGGVYLMTEYGKVHYAISVVFVSLAVGLFVNFPLQRFYVFR